ncbi:MAG: hypothetical protein ABIT20_18090 [Gemmatimonadaceae bacterium]
MTSTPISALSRPEPRWPVILAIFAAVALHFALPMKLRVGPPWTVATIVAMLVVGTQVARYRKLRTAYSVLSFSVLGVLTLGLLWGLGSLLLALKAQGKDPQNALDLLSSGAILWATNVIVFASWYWRLDAGGPSARERRDAHTEGAFLFPQMTYTAPTNPGEPPDEGGWQPHFVDYLFVAFNTSTAFSPTDVPVLSKWAKAAMMIQAMISFTTVVLVAARAVNIL